jgi:quinolinate synthase
MNYIPFLNYKYNHNNNIVNLKKQRNAILLAHYYQVPEIQEMADYVGDSYGLSIQAQNSKSDVIVFAGVKFMAETAKILNPTIKVLLPDVEAGCSLADSCPSGDFKKFINKHPNHIVITYINSSIEVKALSDIICTSSNAVKIVESLPKEQKIIFAPDKNLGNYVMRQTGRDMVLWEGACHVHNQLHIEKVLQLKELYPEYLLLSHPECQGVILEVSNFIGSTTQIIEYARKSPSKKFIVATETGILHQLQKNSPDKKFIIVPADESCACNDCLYMKLITPEKIERSLQEMIFEIEVDEDLRIKAEIPIKRMIDISSGK